MNFVQKLLENIGEIGSYKDITPTQIQNLGYQFSKNNITIKNKETKDNTNKLLIIKELLDEDAPRRTLDFCYLFYADRKTGIILKNPFRKYVRMAEDSKS